MADIIMPESDEAWFRDHPDRTYRIRGLASDKEFQAEFHSLGADNYPRDRRAVIAMRTMFPHSLAGAAFPRIMQIPFLKFADEEIADDDKTLAPIVHEMMGQAKQRYRM